MMIGKGCTCINTFSIPFKKDELKEIVITYRQSGEIVFEKKLCDCSFSDNVAIVHLQQEDTLKFDSSKVIKIQLKVKLGNDSVVKSKIIETVTDEVLNEEVI